jgi:hypothetical protein
VAALGRQNGIIIADASNFMVFIRTPDNRVDSPDRPTSTSSQIPRLVAGIAPQFKKMAIRLQTILITTRHERDLATNVATHFALLSAIFGECAAYEGSGPRCLIVLRGVASCVGLPTFRRAGAIPNR